MFTLPSLFKVEDTYSKFAATCQLLSSQAFSLLTWAWVSPEDDQLSQTSLTVPLSHCVSVGTEPMTLGSPTSPKPASGAQFLPGFLMGDLPAPASPQPRPFSLTMPIVESTGTPRGQRSHTHPLTDQLIVASLVDLSVCAVSHFRGRKWRRRRLCPSACCPHT